MLHVNQLQKSYGSKEVLKGLTFSIPSGSICGFVGKNGAGKTTFFIPYCTLFHTREIFLWMMKPLLLKHTLE